MGDFYLADGKTKVSFVPSIANIAEPTVAELTATAAVSLEWAVLKDGLKMGGSVVTVDTGVLASTVDTQFVGRRKFEGNSIEFYKEDDPTTDKVDKALKYQAKGYLVIRRGVDVDVAFASDDLVEVYPIQFGQKKIEPAENKLESAMIEFTVTSDPRTADNPATVA